MTGAMRNPAVAGADGPANLLAAIQVAAHPASWGRGCLVVFADEIHAAAGVRKMHSTSVATFASPNGAALGYLVEGRTHFLSPPSERVTVRLASEASFRRVALVTATLGDDGDILKAIAEHVDGLVVAAALVTPDLAGQQPLTLVQPQGVHAQPGALRHLADTQTRVLHHADLRRLT